MEHMDISRLDEKPKDFPESKYGRRAYTYNLSLKILSSCWNPPPVEDLRKVSEAMKLRDIGNDIFPFCSCLEGNFLAF